MPEPSWWILALLAALAGIVVVLWRPVRLAARESRLSQAKRNFHRQRERLEAKFIQLASTQAKPDSPRWADCEFDDAVAYVRNRSTGELSAFVAVTVALQGVHDAAAVLDGRLDRQPPRRHCRLPLRSRPLGDRRPGHLEPQPLRGHPLLPGRPRSRRPGTDFALVIARGGHGRLCRRRRLPRQQADLLEFRRARRATQLKQRRLRRRQRRPGRVHPRSAVRWSISNREPAASTAT